jgi:DNA (cytosine-5)-methyltransferase 1
MKCFSLFAGIGGFDLALQRQGHEIVGACEINDDARRVYETNFGKSPRYRDAREIDTGKLPDFDILCAGFPCQSFSGAGLQLGLSDTRGTLFYEISRIAKEKKPQYLLLENVAGLLTNDNARTFTKILIELHEIGYDVEWQLINSKYFVPQNRPRVFIIGHLRGKSKPRVFPIRESEVRDVERRCYQVAKLSNYKFESSSRIYSTKGLARTLKAECGDKTGCYMINGRPSFLSPIECERLQGFPDDWTKGFSKTVRWRLAGNSVTVSLIEYIISKLESTQQSFTNIEVEN